MNEKIILLDSNSLMNRAFYALPVSMRNKDGIVTNAVYGFLSMLSKLIHDENPTHIAAVFDLHAPTFRHIKYEGYKAGRHPMPEELVSQMPLIKSLLREMNVSILEKEGYEADDIIGTIGKRFDYDTIIVSGDRDVLQLIDHNTVVYNTRRGVTDIKVYDLASLAEEGFSPEQIIEYKALAGDSSDNIPGARGVGEKTAISLITAYGSVEGIYSHIDELKGKLKENLLTYRGDVIMSRELATIDTNVPLDCELNDILFDKNKITDKFFRHLEALEAKSLLPRFRYSAGAEKVPEAPPLPPEISVIELDTLEELQNILDGTYSSIAIRIGEHVGFSLDGKTDYRVRSAGTLFDAGIGFDEAVGALGSVLQGSAVKIIYDVKTAMRFFKGYGIHIKEPYEDVLLKAYLSDVSAATKGETELYLKYGFAEPSAAAEYALSAMLDKELADKELSSLYRDIERPLIGALFDMEECGFKIDTATLDAFSVKYMAELRSLTENIYLLAGEKFNVNSPRELGRILFDNLGLQRGKKTKTGYSVAADILEELDHPLVTLVLQYRKIAKLHSTYIEGMRSVIDRSTGKVHTVFKQCLTQTGRLSSTEPNLQNIPIRTEEGREIRKMFVAGEGNALVSADYSQIELRLLAHFSGDEALVDAFNRGVDIHTLTAAKVNRVPIEAVTKEMRRSAKAVNFGIVYGISAFGLSNNIGISPKAAKDFIDRYFETYPRVKSYMDGNVAYARRHGYTRSISGRIRYFPELNSGNHNIRSFGERAAMNMPLQGSASDIIKAAMLKVAAALKDGGYKGKLILQVHDELVVECPESEIEDVARLLKENMESAWKLSVPLTVDVKSGKDWFSVE